MFWQIAVGLQTAPPTDADASRLWRMIADRLAENRLQELSTVLLVDDAGESGADQHAQLIRLSRVETSPAARWTMLLATEIGQAATWRVGLRELIDLRIDVEAWEVADTIGFVQHALLEAGCLSPLFDESALRALHELSGGLPRQVCRMAEFALLAGAAAGATEVDTDLVRSAAEEISWPSGIEFAKA
jgi:general secretion pathway protein A